MALCTIAMWFVCCLVHCFYRRHGDVGLIRLNIIFTRNREKAWYTCALIKKQIFLFSTPPPPPPLSTKNKKNIIITPPPFFFLPPSPHKSNLHTKTPPPPLPNKKPKKKNNLFFFFFFFFFIFYQPKNTPSPLLFHLKLKKISSFFSFSPHTLFPSLFPLSPFLFLSPLFLP